MKFLYGIFGLIVIISMAEIIKADIMDIALPTMFGSKEKKHMSCYECINVTNSDCNQIPSNSTSFVKVCEDGANGCVKKLYSDDGYTIMSRECYYGPVKIYHDFSCDGTKINYAQEKCHMCTSDLCNSSTNLHSSPYVLCIWVLSAIFLIRHVP